MGQNNQIQVTKQFGSIVKVDWVTIGLRLKKEKIENSDRILVTLTLFKPSLGTRFSFSNLSLGEFGVQNKVTETKLC